MSSPRLLVYERTLIIAAPLFGEEVSFADHCEPENLAEYHFWIDASWPLYGYLKRYVAMKALVYESSGYMIGDKLPPNRASAGE